MKNRISGSVAFFLCVLAISSIISPQHSSARGRAINVLYITSFEAGNANIGKFLDAFKASVSESGRKAEVFLESLDAVRFTLTPGSADLLQAMLADRFRDIRLDIILAQSGIALEAALRFRTTYDPGLPIYCFDMIDPDVVKKHWDAKNVFGRSLKTPFPPTLRLARRLFPNTKQALFFVNSGAPKVKEAFEEALDSLREEFSGVEFIPLVNTDFRTAEAALAAAGKDAVAFFLPGGWTLPNGDLLFGTDMVDVFSAIRPIPFFSILDDAFGSGLVGGAFVDYEAMGREAAEMAVAVLFGTEKPIPWLMSNATVEILDHRALKRFSVPASNVPSDAKIMFAPPGFWIRYETQLKSGGAFLLLVLLALIAYTVFRGRERRLLKALNEKLEAAVEERTSELTTANTELTTANRNLITSLRRIESLQERLVAETRDTVLGRIAMGLAHEINNPLAAVKAASFSMRSVLSGRRGGPGFHVLLSKLEGARLDLFLDMIRFAEDRDGMAVRAESSAERSEFESRLKRLGLDLPPEVSGLLFDAGLSRLPDGKLEAAAAPENRDVLDCVYRARVLDRGVSIVEVAADRIAERVEAVRSYARDSGSVDRASSASVSSTIEQSILLFREALREGVSVVRSLDADLPPVAAPESGLVRLWTNLIQNAIQAMKGRGTIELRSRREGKSVVVEVLDSGPGVDPSLKDELFTPFAAADDMSRGMGLGLSICRRIVENAGGEIFHSEEEGRTKFGVRLPAAELPPDE